MWTFPNLIPESKLTPEQRVKITCDLSNTFLAIFLSSLVLSSLKIIINYLLLIQFYERV